MNHVITSYPEFGAIEILSAITNQEHWCMVVQANDFQIKHYPGDCPVYQEDWDGQSGWYNLGSIEFSIVSQKYQGRIAVGEAAIGPTGNYFVQLLDTSEIITPINPDRPNEEDWVFETLPGAIDWLIKNLKGTFWYRDIELLGLSDD